MIQETEIKELIAEHGTPLFVVDHDEIRRNYAEFRKQLPRVQAYYAVKANPDPAIVRTLYEAGGELRRGLDARVRDRLRVHQGPAAEGAAGLHLGQDHLRQSDQGQRDAPRSRSVQAAGDVRQLRGDRQDSQARPARRPGPAAARAQHRGDGRAVVEVRRRLGRGRAN